MFGIKLFKEIKGVFKPPVRKYYIGKIVHYCPYFLPTNVCTTIIRFRKLKLRDQVEYEEAIKESPWLKESKRFTNMPMVRRAKDWVFKVFGNWYWLQWGWPMYIFWHNLGWKDKYDTPRFEWAPAFYVFFFKWQFCIHWLAPDGNNDKYYEMILWWKNYCNKDIKKAEKSWGWTDMKTKQSTWNKNYLV